MTVAVSARRPPPLPQHSPPPVPASATGSADPLPTAMRVNQIMKRLGSYTEKAKEKSKEPAEVASGA
jgi:hypothetical protein